MSDYKNVSWKFLVKTYCDKYVVNKKAAEDWAKKNVKKEYFVILRPLIKEALLKRGIKA